MWKYYPKNCFPKSPGLQSFWSKKRFLAHFIENVFIPEISIKCWSYFIPILTFLHKKKISLKEGTFWLLWHENKKSAVQKFFLNKEKHISVMVVVLYSISVPIQQCKNILVKITAPQCTVSQYQCTLPNFLALTFKHQCAPCLNYRAHCTAFLIKVHTISHIGPKNPAWHPLPQRPERCSKYSNRAHFSKLPETPPSTYQRTLFQTFLHVLWNISAHSS